MSSQYFSPKRGLNSGGDICQVVAEEKEAVHKNRDHLKGHRACSRCDLTYLSIMALRFAIRPLRGCLARLQSTATASSTRILYL